MKKMIFLSALVFLVLIMFIYSGCSFIPQSPEEAAEEATEDDISLDDGSDTGTVTVPASPEDAAEDIISQVVEKEKKQVVVEQNLTNETNETAELSVSGSLDLQSDKELCPHLADSFTCDKYDIRRCKFNTFVGKNDFYPDLINCRQGYSSRGEKENNRYCIMQSCGPLHENNIVYAYGGVIAYAEYTYTESKTATGIMTSYGLLRCGETTKEFDSEFNCTVYKSELEGLWTG